MMGCVGYHNYQYFLQFAFWGALHLTLDISFIAMFRHEMPFSYLDWIYFVSSFPLIIFGWAVFVIYGAMALRGVTIIEASTLFQSRREQVGAS
jgi:hypothetical protein